MFKRFHLIVLFFGLLLINRVVLAQDEKVLRDLFKGTDETTLATSEALNPLLTPFKVHFTTQTPVYELDLTGDGQLEKLIYKYQDGESSFSIYSPKSEKLYETKFQTNGFGQALYKVTYSQLSKDLKLLLLYFYEGKSEYIQREVRSRLYFLTFKNNNIRKSKTFLGPYIWYEKENPIFDNHLERFYKINIHDYTGNGTKDIAIKHGSVTRVFTYQEKGDFWKEL